MSLKDKVAKLAKSKLESVVANPEFARSAEQAISNPMVEKEAAAAAPSLLEKVGRIAATPQRLMLKKIAEKLGKPGTDKDTQGNSEQIVEAVAEKLGVPEDSSVGNAFKAVGVGGLEMFADPTMLLPFNKLGKIASKLGNMRKSKAVAEIVEKTAPKVQTVIEKGAELAKKGKFGKIVDAEQEIRNLNVRNFADTLVKPEENFARAYARTTGRKLEKVAPNKFIKSRP